MKRILSLVFTLFILTASCYAESLSEKMTQAAYNGPVKKIAVLMDAPATYADNEKIRQIVPQKTSEIFPGPKFQILPFDECQMTKTIYREEHGMITVENTTSSIIPLKIADVKAIGETLGADYVFLLNVSNSAPRISAGLFSISFKTTITCDSRLMDVAAGKYLMMKQTIKDGKSTAVLGGIPSFDRAYHDALTKSLSELEINTSNL